MHARNNNKETAEQTPSNEAAGAGVDDDGSQPEETR